MKLLFITNDVAVARAADSAGVDEVFLDLEIHGKGERQSGRNTVISNHQVVDIPKIKSVLSSASLLVRCNPMGSWTTDELEEIIARGADVIMLPFFKTEKEVQTFMDNVAGRVRTCLLVETIEALENLDSILAIDGVERIHIGLNDLHIAFRSKFMFEPFVNGILDRACKIAKQHGVSFGVGGIGRIGSNLKPSPERLLAEHRRLGSSAVILSRSFLNLEKEVDIDNVSIQFDIGVDSIREWESRLDTWTLEMFEENRMEVERQINEVIQT